MRHLAVELWSRGESGLHRRDPRAKLVVLLVILVTLATTYRHVAAFGLFLFLTLLAGYRWAGIAWWAALSRAGIVLSFTLPFALVALALGEPARALAILLKSYLSAMAVLLIISTTPISRLFRGLEALGAPHFLLMVAQFVHRYLFVLFEEASHMRTAALARGANRRDGIARRSRFRAAAGLVGTLFARSYKRSTGIHHAMVARGFMGRLPAIERMSFGSSDAVFVAIAGLLPVLGRFAVETLR